MNKTNIEALELYIATLEQALEKAKIKQQRAEERERKKLEKFKEEYPTRNDIDTAYGYASISSSKRDQLVEMFDNLDKVENEETPLGRYINLLKRHVRNFDLEIKINGEDMPEQNVPSKEEVESPEGLILSEKYRIVSDELNITVQESYISKNAEHLGEKMYKNVSYHPSIAMAIKSIIADEINSTGLKDIKTVPDKIEDLKKYVEEFIKE